MTELRLSTNFLIEVAKGNVQGHSIIEKFGRNSDIDVVAPPNDFETIWNGGGMYTGFDQVTPDTVSVVSDNAADTGTLVNNGTATGGSASTLISTGISGVSVGDVLINDTQQDHGIVLSSTSTVITVRRFVSGTIPVSGDVYRVATQASTGSPVIKMHKLFDSNYDMTTEYLIMNGTTDVLTTGSYIRSTRSRTHGGLNIGVISAFATGTPANIYQVMPALQNTTTIAADTIPRGFTGFIVEWFAALANNKDAVSEIQFKVRLVDDEFQTQAEAAALNTGSSFLPQVFPAMKGAIFEMSDFEMNANTSKADTAVTAAWTMLLVDNNFLNKAQ